MIELTTQEKIDIIDTIIDSLINYKLDLESELEEKDINYVEFIHNQTLYLQEKINFLQNNAVNLIEK